MCAVWTCVSIQSKCDRWQYAWHECWMFVYVFGCVTGYMRAAYVSVCVYASTEWIRIERRMCFNAVFSIAIKVRFVVNCRHGHNTHAHSVYAFLTNNNRQICCYQLTDFEFNQVEILMLSTCNNQIQKSLCQFEIGYSAISIFFFHMTFTIATIFCRTTQSIHLEFHWF